MPLPLLLLLLPSCAAASGDGGASSEGASGQEGSHALVVDGRGGLWQLGLNEIVALKDPANPLGGFDVDVEVRWNCSNVVCDYT